jgi:hypothetical protein
MTEINRQVTLYELIYVKNNTSICILVLCWIRSTARRQYNVYHFMIDRYYTSSILCF